MYIPSGLEDATEPLNSITSAILTTPWRGFMIASVSTQLSNIMSKITSILFKKKYIVINLSRK
jgi:hypothetical protein